MVSAAMARTPARQVLKRVLISALITSGAASPPNIVMIMTDDQDVLLGSLDTMPSVHKNLIQQGVVFDRSYVTTPICCPSRTSSLTSLYAHNLNDQTLGWCGDFQSRENQTYVQALHDAGYTTGWHGKWYNGYADFCDKNIHVPTGYDDFFVMCNDGHYFGNKFNDNGVNVKLPDTTYMTAAIGNRSITWLEQALKGTAPVFMYVGPHAPHVPATVAPWYDHAPLPSEQAPRTPNWGVEGVEKHWLVASRPPLDAVMTNFSDQLYARRLRSLLSVEDIVTAVIDTLEAANALENTYIFYTSDHGYDLGQFRMPSGKFELYENVIRVPLIVRGPNITANTTSEAMVANIDLGPTFLELAGAAPRKVDGKSFAGWLGKGAQPSNWRDTLLLNYDSMGWVWRGPCDNGTTACPGGPEALEDAPSNTFVGLRIHNASMNIAYAEYRDRNVAPYPSAANWTELYNMTADPFQLVNIWKTAPPALVTTLSNELYSYVNCTFAACP